MFLMRIPAVFQNLFARSAAIGRLWLILLMRQMRQIRLMRQMRLSQLNWPCRHLCSTASLSLYGVWLLGGCSMLPSMGSVMQVLPESIGSFGIYRIELVQGNVVTREQIAAVRLGASRADVRDILGSPMLTDVFHEQRWDYPFSIRRGQQQLQQRVVTITFDGDRVSRIEGSDDLPSERDFVASISRYKAPDQPLPALTLSEEQRKALPAPVRRESQGPVTPQGAARSYPPLETR